jgi:hypothetical protein
MQLNALFPLVLCINYSHLCYKFASFLVRILSHFVAAVVPQVNTSKNPINNSESV